MGIQSENYAIDDCWLLIGKVKDTVLYLRRSGISAKENRYSGDVELYYDRDESAAPRCLCVLAMKGSVDKLGVTINEDNLKNMNEKKWRNKFTFELADKPGYSKYVSVGFDEAGQRDVIETFRRRLMTIEDARLASETKPVIQPSRGGQQSRYSMGANSAPSVVSTHCVKEDRHVEKTFSGANQTTKTPKLVSNQAAPRTGLVDLFVANKNIPQLLDKENRNVTPPKKKLMGMKDAEGKTMGFQNALCPRTPENRVVTNRAFRFSPYKSSLSARHDSGKPHHFFGRSMRRNLNKPEDTETIDSGKGFRNLGNTCYMNAVMQCLLSLREFVADLKLQLALLESQWQQDGSGDEKMRCRLLRKVCALGQKASELRVEDSDLIGLKAVVSDKVEQFAGTYQQDAQEFLNYALDEMKMEMAGCAAGNNPVERNLEFIVEQQIQCCVCPCQTNSREMLNMLSLTVPTSSGLAEPECSIQDLICAHFSAEEVEFTCPECECSRATITHKFANLPRYLVVHLKRYAYNHAQDTLGKNNVKLELHSFLSLKHQVSEKLEDCAALSPQKQKSCTVLPIDVPDCQPSTAFADVAASKRLRFDGRPSLTDPSDDPVLTRHCGMQTIEEEDVISLVDDATPVDLMTEEQQIERAIELSMHEVSMVSAADKEDADWNACMELCGLAENKSLLGEGGDGVVDVTRDLPSEPEMVEFREPNGSSATKENLPQIVPLSSPPPEDKLPELPTDDSAMLPLVAEVDGKKDDDKHSEVEDNTLTAATILSSIDGSQRAELKQNFESGSLEHSFRLCSVVSHIGRSVSSGHYVADVFDFKDSNWSTFDDSAVRKVTRDNVLVGRRGTAYLLFFANKLTSCC